MTYAAGRVFEAKYPGQCANCPEPVRIGDMVRVTTTDEALIHDECEDDTHVPVNAKQPPLCSHCWLEHAGDECP